ncbi:MAG: hypothetical protein ACF8OB_10975, partial [Phycisphaeraceae bacterium JB051]
MLLSTVTVTGTADLIDGDTSSIAALIATPGNDGEITLREAVQAANNTVGEDVIEFDQALAGETITLESSLLVFESVSINGLGDDQLTLHADDIASFFDIDLTGDVDGVFNLNNITLTGVTDIAINAHPGNLVLDNITFLGDSTTGGEFVIHANEITSTTVISSPYADLTIEAQGEIQFNEMYMGGDTAIYTDGFDVSFSGVIDSLYDQTISGTTLVIDVSSGNLTFNASVTINNTGSGDVTIPDGNNVGGGSSVISDGGSGSGSFTIGGPNLVTSNPE